MTLSTALRTRDLAELPSRRAEAWRYSDLRAAVRTLPPPSPAGVEFGHSPFAGIAGETVAFLNGRRLDAVDVHSVHLVHHDSPVHSAPALDDLDGLDSFAGVQRAPDLDEVHSVHLVHLRFLSDATATAHSATYDLVVPAGAKVVLLESYEGRGAAYVANAELTIHVGEGAALERIVIAEEPADAVSVSTATVTVEGGAMFRQTVLATGAKLQRLETHVRHPGAGASVRLDGLYLLGERRHADLTTVVVHEGEGGATSQLTKGVVGGEARGVFQGRITVLKGADRTDARMGHHALLLSDRAEVDAKPELEIWADDVSCAHGNTVGALDEEALFYARSRGIPEAEAKAMLTLAFLGEVVERVEHLGAREVLRTWVERRLEGLGA